jgi:hypothetical protein
MKQVEKGDIIARLLEIMEVEQAKLIEMERAKLAKEEHKSLPEEKTST